MHMYNFALVIWNSKNHLVFVQDGFLFVISCGGRVAPSVC
jgi:hypothetical protein